MKSTKCMLLLTAVLFLCSALAPGTTPANEPGEITVNNISGAACAQPDCYTSIADALSAASTSTGITLITVEPGTYTETLTLTTNIVLRGRETAAAFLSSSITVTTGTHTIKNLTFTGASGIIVTDSPTLLIANNIFQGDAANTAVQIAAGSTGVRLVNNVFYGNGLALYTDADVEITNNIFMSNTTIVSTASVTIFNNVSYNTFYSNTDTADWSASDNYSAGDPQFVNASANDFHLLTGSPAINTGSPTYPNYFDTATFDRGAYGGSNTDTIPLIVSDITASSSTTSIDVSWSANLSYLVTGYNVYYGTASGVYDSYGTVDSATTTTTLTGLVSSATKPGTPVLNQPEVANQSLMLSWTAVSGATSYRVYYDKDDGTSSLPTTMIDVGDKTSYTLTGLTNDINYKIALTAVSQTTYYVAVTALNGTVGPYDPGISYESAYSEVSVNVGDSAESDLSSVIVDYPEALVAYPNLPNKGQGCFIATAAYGYYGAPQVQALRDFRDRYLLTNRAGSAFVSWYYEHGPAGAAYLDAHPAWKPLVRAALLPAVGGSLFLTKAPLSVRILVILCILGIALVTAYRFSVKRISGSGGVA